MKTNPSPFKFRPFVSVMVSASFVMLVVTGAVLFLAPPGRIANWTDWRILALGKHDWIDLHIWFALVFLLAALCHLWLNWKPLISYFKSRATKRLGLRWEWVAAGIVCVGIFAGTRAAIPPFSNVLAWNEQLKWSWDKPTEQAPIAHAELLSLGELAEQANVPWETAQKRLVNIGLEGVTTEVEVRALADQNRMTPARVYELITGDSGQGRGEGDNAREGGRGSGYGWKTLRVVCEELGANLAEVQARLKAKGIDAAPDDTLRDIAVRAGYDRPGELMDTIRQR